MIAAVSLRLYLIFQQFCGCSCCSDERHPNDVELLVLRHEVAVLGRTKP
jgi:hypothetical protein